MDSRLRRGDRTERRPSRHQAVTIEKPLFVMVAEALGCKVEGPPHYQPYRCGCFAKGYPHGSRQDEDPDVLAEYDTDWSAIGPLIEKHEIAIEESGCGYTQEQKWLARADFYAENPTDRVYGGAWATAEARGATPLIAVCNLILALHAAGKLTA